MKSINNDKTDMVISYVPHGINPEIYKPLPVPVDFKTKIFGDKKYKTSPIIKRMVRANLMGKRTGEGFYIYENEKRRSKAGSIINLGREI